MTTFANPFYYVGDRSQPWDAPAVLSGLSSQLDKMTNPILKILFLNLFIFLPLSACKAEEVQTLQSLPFLAVDLNGNGKIDTIPLEKSEVYFDVDGDGLAERTEWISPEDGFLAVIAKRDLMFNSKESTMIQQLNAFFVDGYRKVKEKDKNFDNQYNSDDYDVYQHSSGDIVSKLGFRIFKDTDSNGLPEGERELTFSCNLISFKFDNAANHSKLQCSDREYNVYKINAKYEDSNVLWSAACAKLSYLGSFFNEDSVSHFQCLEQGYEPQGMWSKNVWEEYKKGNNND